MRTLKQAINRAVVINGEKHMPEEKRKHTGNIFVTGNSNRMLSGKAA